MSLGGISFGGLASGLDTNAIIGALLAVEKVPIQQLESQKALEQKKLSLLGTFEGYVDALRTKAKELSTLGGFNSYTVTPCVEGVAAFEVTGAAPKGSHTLTVNSLASAERWAFAGVPDATVDLGAGNVSFDYDGQSYSVAVGAAASSLNEIAAAINTATEGEVTASVVNVGTEASASYQLVLAGKDTGADFQIGNLASTVAGLTGPVELVNASNASITVDGLAVQRSTNDFNDVVAGLSIEVLAADPGTTISFTVAGDAEGVKEKLKAFVDAYNKVIEFTNQQNTYDVETQTAPELFGDTVLRSVRQELTNTLYGVDLNVVMADTEGYSTLGLVGIETKADGTLEIDDEVLTKKLESNPELFSDLFVDTDGFNNDGAAPGTPEYYVDTTTDSGVFEKLWRNIDKLKKSTPGPAGTSLKGLFAAHKETFNKKIEGYNDQIEKLEFNIEQLEETLVKKFSALEEVMAGLSAQQTALLNQIQSL